MKACGAFLFAVTVWSLLVPHSLAQTRSVPNPARVASFERKLQHLQSNGAQPHPDPSPMELSEQEINAYFASGNVDLPAGVRSVVFQEQPGMIIGTARVDFDQLKAGKNSYNPLLSIFSGLHDVVVTSHAYGAKGQGLALTFPNSFWNCSWKNTLSRSIPISAWTRDLRCRPAWTRR
jgi:hypothetical protein